MILRYISTFIIIELLITVIPMSFIYYFGKLSPEVVTLLIVPFIAFTITNLVISFIITSQQLPFFPIWNLQ